MCPVVIVATALGAQEPTEFVARRLPFGAPVVGVPLTPDSLQRAMAEVAWTARIPIGYEALEDEPWQPRAPTGIINVAGQTVEEVLNAIVAHEPRYRWTEDDGVLHLRPRAALADSNSVLNRTIEGFIIEGATLELALRELRYTLRPEWRQGGITSSMRAQTGLGVSRFTVNVRQASVQGILDAIVKAHGASSWHVTYEADSGIQREYRIGFDTFDGWGITW